MLKLEEGKYYRDVNGSKQGPIHDYNSPDGYGWSHDEIDRAWWDENGKAQEGSDAVDLVAEWVEPAPCEGKVPSQQGPTRTVTRLEVVPGVYDLVRVTIPDDRGANLHVTFALHDPSADELDAAAAVLTELAKAVRGNV